MLGKMIKHEFKATSRLYIPLFMGVIMLTPLLGLLMRISSRVGEKTFVGGMVTGISVFGFIVMMVGLSIGSIFFIILRFYKTVATSEAYLTFCLPVKPSHILTSKLIVGVIWELLSLVLALGSLYVLFLIVDSGINDVISKAFDTVYPIISLQYGSVAMFLLHIGLVVVVSTISGTLSFYLAICLGQLFNSHRVLASLGMYVAVYTAGQILSILVFMPFLLGSAKTVVGNSQFINSGADLTDIPTVGILMAVIGLQVVLAIVYYFISMIILKKKTNVK